MSLIMQGILYSQIGEVYYDQMNYSRAYHYFREARNNFRQTDNTREETEATLDMAAATSIQRYGESHATLFCRTRFG